MSKITKKQQAANAMKWIDTLAFKNYKQGQGVLGNKKVGYCCWGVGCKVMKLDYEPHEEWDGRLYDLIGIPKDFDFSSETKNDYFHDHFMSLNDELQWKFPRIAAFILIHAHKIFDPTVAKIVRKELKDSEKLTALVDKHIEKINRVTFHFKAR